MTPDEADRARKLVNVVYRSDSRRVLAILIRLLDNFDVAEEALHDAFAAAVEQWPRNGIPSNSRAWLVSGGRFKAIDAIRRRVRFDASAAKLARELEATTYRTADSEAVDPADQSIVDDRLRLIFSCCHPPSRPRPRLRSRFARSADSPPRRSQAPFSLRRRRWRCASCARSRRSALRAYPTRSLRGGELPDRLDAVLRVIYLVFNEGYSASSGATLTMSDLSGEAIGLGRLLVELLPEPEGVGPLTLMLLQESRRAARSSIDGELLLLNEQDRSLWNRKQIKEGVALVGQALASRRFGPYTLQAAIAGMHAEASSAEAIRTEHTVELFGLLGGGKRDAGWDGSGRPLAELAILPDSTQYTIFSSPVLASTVRPFLAAPMTQAK